MEKIFPYDIEVERRDSVDFDASEASKIVGDQLRGGIDALISIVTAGEGDNGVVACVEPFLAYLPGLARSRGLDQAFDKRSISRRLTVQQIGKTFIVRHTVHTFVLIV